ncbi:MAG: primosomal protein N' [Flavobacteriaceae bacterium]|nr:primosomal protein N' [Flavobacteriaceae bacterium]
MKLFFISVVLPIPLTKLFTYRITEEESEFLEIGMRVAVPFGKSRITTALVREIHNTPPEGYVAKDIFQILDDAPIVNEKQFTHWEWMASYYMCSLGEVFRAAIPSTYLLESETSISLNPEFKEEEHLSEHEFLIFEALQFQSEITIQEITKILDKKNVLPVLGDMLSKEVIKVKEYIYEQYKPKLIKYICLNDAWAAPEKLASLLELLSRAKKQRDVVMCYFQLNAQKKPIPVKELMEKSGVSTAVIKTLVDKGILDYYHLQVDRVTFEGQSNALKTLNEFQQKAYDEILTSFETKSTTLLQGVTSSGKTEIYAHLIKKTLEEGKQVVYLLPEIALTTQLIQRLQVYFGDYLSVFHSKYSMNERVEVWQNMLAGKTKAQFIIGARSGMFLPFSNIGLIIIDEEHEPSFKQQDPAPRYHARDAAVVLAHIHKAKVLMGSATPSIESFYNAQQGKYGYVELTKRYNNVKLPLIELIDVKEKHRKKRMKGHFSDRLLEMIQDSLKEKEQVILFQNRRGFAPIVECDTCGVSPECPNCDVSLTFHKYKREIRCHYCGYHQAMMYNCKACGSEKLNTKGFGTEQIELELEQLFPEANIGRMDFDTTKGKRGFEKIIGKFQGQEIDILVGTQMLSKGLDFSNVSLVGIMNSDTMLNFPDFRAHERSYQLMVQVSGRSGRSSKQGRVAIQTFNPYHQILQQVASNDYPAMYKEQLDERWQFQYPPFFRIIKVTLKHKDEIRIEEGMQWLTTSLTNVFGTKLLGPTVPSVSRVRNLYIRNFIIKIGPKDHLVNTKKNLERVRNSFHAIGSFRAIRFNIDVDAV